jgi:hypothetical protein
MIHKFLNLDYINKLNTMFYLIQAMNMKRNFTLFVWGQKLFVY